MSFAQQGVHDGGEPRRVSSSRPCPSWASSAKPLARSALYASSTFAAHSRAARVHPLAAWRRLVHSVAPQVAIVVLRISPAVRSARSLNSRANLCAHSSKAPPGLLDLLLAAPPGARAARGGDGESRPAVAEDGDLRVANLCGGEALEESTQALKLRRCRGGVRPRGTEGHGLPPADDRGRHAPILESIVGREGDGRAFGLLCRGAPAKVFDLRASLRVQGGRRHIRVRRDSDAEEALAEFILGLRRAIVGEGRTRPYKVGAGRVETSAKASRRHFSAALVPASGSVLPDGGSLLTARLRCDGGKSRLSHRACSHVTGSLPGGGGPRRGPTATSGSATRCRRCRPERGSRCTSRTAIASSIQRRSVATLCLPYSKSSVAPPRLLLQPPRMQSMPKVAMCLGATSENCGAATAAGRRPGRSASQGRAFLALRRPGGAKQPRGPRGRGPQS